MKDTHKINPAVVALSFTHDAVVLREIDKSTALDKATALLLEVLTETNEAVSAKLYTVDAEKEQQYLAQVTHLYGAFTHNAGNLVGVIAIEEDAIERIVVQQAFQGQGIGAEMLRAARIAFNAEYVDVFADNKRALNFFEAQGMSMFDETAPEPGDLSAEHFYKIIHLMY